MNDQSSGRTAASADDTAHQHEQFDSISHNYDAMNRAIDTQVDKQLELSSLYHYHQTSRRTLMLMHITVSLCVLALTCSAIWWLFSTSGYSSTGVSVITALTEPAIIERKTSDALRVISEAQETDENPDSSFIDTSFTVFHRTLISSGEYVVTGKIYQPDNLQTPSEQYCYLEQAQNSKQLSGQPLSYIEDRKLVLETENKGLISLAHRFCQFSR